MEVEVDQCREITVHTQCKWSSASDNTIKLPWIEFAVTNSERCVVDRRAPYFYALFFNTLCTVGVGESRGKCFKNLKSWHKIWLRFERRDRNKVQRIKGRATLCARLKQFRYEPFSAKLIGTFFKKWPDPRTRSKGGSSGEEASFGDEGMGVEMGVVSESKCYRYTVAPSLD